MEINNDSFQFIFGSTVRALHKMVGTEFQKKGLALSPEQFHLLKIIASKEDAIQAELANILQLDKSGVMRHIDQLEEKRFLQRVSDVNDRRKKYLTLTELGFNELEKSKIIINELNYTMLNGITEDELILFKQVLTKLRDNAELASNLYADQNT